MFNSKTDMKDMVKMMEGLRKKVESLGKKVEDLGEYLGKKGEEKRGLMKDMLKAMEQLDARIGRLENSIGFRTERELQQVVKNLFGENFLKPKRVRCLIDLAALMPDSLLFDRGDEHSDVVTAGLIAAQKLLDDGIPMKFLHRLHSTTKRLHLARVANEIKNKENDAKAKEGGAYKSDKLVADAGDGPKALEMFPAGDGSEVPGTDFSGDGLKDPGKEVAGDGSEVPGTELGPDPNFTRDGSKDPGNAFAGDGSEVPEPEGDINPFMLLELKSWNHLHQHDLPLFKRIENFINATDKVDCLARCHSFGVSAMLFSIDESLIFKENGEMTFYSDLQFDVRGQITVYLKVVEGVTVLHGSIETGEYSKSVKQLSVRLMALYWLLTLLAEKKGVKMGHVSKIGRLFLPKTIQVNEKKLIKGAVLRASKDFTFSLRIHLV